MMQAAKFFVAAILLLAGMAGASADNYRSSTYRGEFSDWVPGGSGGRDYDRDDDHDYDDDNGRSYRRRGICSPRDADCCFNFSRRGPEAVTLSSGDSICKALKRVSPGGTIFLNPGNYSGAFTIYSAVTLQGPAAGRYDDYYEPQLSSRPRPKPVISSSGYCMMVDDRVSGSVFISGVDFKLNAAGASPDRKKPACLVINGGAVTLQSATIAVQGKSYGPTAGILLHGGNVHIERSRVEGARYGVFVGESWKPGSYYLVQSTLSRNGTGLRVQGMVDLHAFGNTISGNGGFSGNDGDGIVIDGGGGTFVSNEIYENNGNGIVLNEDVQRPRFLTNLIDSNRRSGIYAPFGGDARFERNSVTYNGAQGFRCAQEPCPTFGDDNVLEGNQGDCKSSFWKSCGRDRDRDSRKRRSKRDEAPPPRSRRGSDDES
jgi:hypothetical protein